LSAVERVFPSDGNFLLVKMRLSNAATANLTDVLMEERSIHVKDLSRSFDDGSGYLRLAVRRHEENEQLRDALAELASRNVPAAAPSLTRP
ncbi:MAG: hypothetical protein ACRDYY_16685, partial [Acidimicrobiales bacterium]